MYFEVHSEEKSPKHACRLLTSKYRASSDLGKRATVFDRGASSVRVRCQNRQAKYPLYCLKTRYKKGSGVLSMFSCAQLGEKDFSSSTAASLHWKYIPSCQTAPFHRKYILFARYKKVQSCFFVRYPPSDRVAGAHFSFPGSKHGKASRTFLCLSPVSSELLRGRRS